jgi:hypothetical protein
MNRVSYFFDKGVSPLNEQNVQFLAQHGITLTSIEPMGAKCTGLDLRKTKPSKEIVKVLQEEMAYRGFIVFSG